MATALAELLGQLTLDPWRQQVGFSKSVEDAHRSIFGAPVAEATTALNAWIQKNQPCLFGRLAARFGLIQYCILTEEDLLAGDDLIEEKIQNSRLAWSQNAGTGAQSGFIIALISRRLAYALPDSVMGEFARRLASLYLLEPIDFDQIYLESVSLDVPGRKPKQLMWDAGVNYFSANADGRWWQDHCIPAGMAFSINSVGHMVKSAQLSKALRRLDESVGLLADEESALSKVSSLGEALRLAMQTISLASEGPSGKATQLLPIGQQPKQCPIKLEPPLSHFDFAEYLGFYHTDITLPSEYFNPAVERPAQVKPHRLDFTYLFDKNLDNPDFVRMGEGRRIRSASFGELPLEERARKRRKAAPEDRGEDESDNPPVRSGHN